MKIYVCPCGPSMSIWRSHNGRYGYVISTVLDGGGLNAPVWSVALPTTVTTDADIAAFVTGVFVATVAKEVMDVLAPEDKPLPELHDTFGGTPKQIATEMVVGLRSQLGFMARRYDD